jgi:hypothetical protein
VPSELEISNHQWTIDDMENKTVKSYTQSDSEGVKHELGPDDLDNENIAFHWIDGGTDLEVTYEATVEGVTCSDTVSFEVERPSATLSSTTTTLDPPIDYSMGWMRFGDLSGNPGIKWVAEVTTPDIGAGQIAFVQTVDADHRRILVKDGSEVRWETDGYLLDSADTDPLYQGSTIIGGSDVGSHEKWDSPGDRGETTDWLSATTVSTSVNFHLYLMYKSIQSGSVWVTLRRLEWFWDGGASRGDETWEMEPGQDSSEDPASSNSIELPEWAGRAQADVNYE